VNTDYNIITSVILVDVVFPEFVFINVTYSQCEM